MKTLHHLKEHQYKDYLLNIKNKWKKVGSHNWIYTPDDKLQVYHCGGNRALRPYYASYDCDSYCNYLTARDIQPTYWPDVDPLECQNTRICALTHLITMQYHATKFFERYKLKLVA